ncbi:MAG: hypothetical protein KAU06_09895 [Candidatus Marinimicrobia bacterium]|nr:hypothetical protein [Candidatus Neomarinimicrobiota bacterium]
MKYIISPAVINKKIFGACIILILILVQSGFAGNQMNDYRSDLSATVNKVIQLNNQIEKLDTKIADIDREISVLDNRKKPSWLDRRKVVKLTEEKAAINTDNLNYYQQLLELQNSARATSSALFALITNDMDSLVTELNSNLSVDQRKAGLDYLIRIIEIRNWVIDTKTYYTHVDDVTIPSKMNIGDFIQSGRTNVRLKSDLVNFLDEKIQQISVMIDAAREEEALRTKLDQFALEMTVLGGEIDHQSYQSDVKIASEPEKYWGVFLDNTDSPSNNRGYNNWVSTTQSHPLVTYISEYDYLPVIKDMESSEFPEYISTLDSIRTYYINQKQELLNR